jgi:hypothetical protein
MYAFYKDDVYKAMKRKLLSLKCQSKELDSEMFPSRQNRPKTAHLLPLDQFGKSV